VTKLGVEIASSNSDDYDDDESYRIIVLVFALSFSVVLFWVEDDDDGIVVLSLRLFVIVVRLLPCPWTQSREKGWEPAVALLAL